MTRVMWIRDPGWDLDRPWERNERIWTNEYPDYYLTLEPGERAIDVTGREVFEGDRIAVAVTAGRSANLRVGKVIRIFEIMTDDYHDEDGNYSSKPRKVGTNRFKIECEWEASGWQNHVKNSSIEAALPKYIKL